MCMYTAAAWYTWCLRETLFFFFFIKRNFSSYSGKLLSCWVLCKVLCLRVVLILLLHDYKEAKEEEEDNEKKNNKKQKQMKAVLLVLKATRHSLKDQIKSEEEKVVKEWRKKKAFFSLSGERKRGMPTNDIRREVLLETSTQKQERKRKKKRKSKACKDKKTDV